MAKNLLQRIMGGDEAAQLGNNKPPSDMEILQERISENNKEILAGADELVAQADKMPAAIESDEQAGAFTDLIKDLRGAWKKMESTRVAEKEPYLALSRAEDGFFNGTKDRLGT